MGIDRARHLLYGRFINYRSVVTRIDALFEAALGTALVAGGFGAADFPHPVGRPLVVVLAVVLFLVAVVLWLGRVGLRVLALANAATAGAGVAWLALAGDFSSSGRAIVIAAVAALAGLAATQAATLRA